MAIKVDMAKAFDRMEWQPIFQVLSILSFPTVFIKWIHSCISTASFILLNGSPIGSFSSSHRLRQDDPLSPLFIIGAEILTRILLWEEQKTNLKGIQIGRGGPTFSHLLMTSSCWGEPVLMKQRYLNAVSNNTLTALGSF